MKKNLLAAGLLTLAATGAMAQWRNQHLMAFMDKLALAIRVRHLRVAMVLKQ